MRTLESTTSVILWILCIGLFLILVSWIIGNIRRERFERKLRRHLLSLVTPPPNTQVEEDRLVWHTYGKRHGHLPMAFLGMKDTPEVERELREIREAIRQGKASLTTAAGIKAGLTIEDLDSRNNS
jgi:hypothetical protein